MSHMREPGRRKVLLLLGEVYADGGIQRFNRTFIAACGRLGVECDVLALNDSPASVRRWTAPPSIRITVFKHNKVRFALAVVTAALFGSYDFVVVGHINLLTLVVAAIAPRRLGNIRRILIAHGIEVWSHIDGPRRHALRAIDTILCVSRYTAEMIQAQAPELAAERFRIFPNALSESWVQGFGALSGTSDRKQLPEHFLLSVTRLDRNDRYKGIVTVIEALAMLEDPSVHYIVAGNGDDRAFLEGTARRLNVAHRVHFVGGVTDIELAELYRRCTAFVLPSGKEGFGIVFLEAMYFGAPVIAAAAKGAMDVVRQEQTGLLVPYGDTVALKVAVERLLSDPGLCELVRAGSRREVTADGSFTFAAYVRRLAEIFEMPAPPAALSYSSSVPGDAKLATETGRVEI
jgi:phosphatidyl-myo-inositol dimannoside synthase